ncbi:enoyl-CoA hydratase/isomerase family protein [Usitatibacter palustris]|uniref:3-hydroxyisobutyryl-CoA hydrolase n=1 Tax=Usitatibacter palustris TaxID=2732487 RepID=A0A6M4H7T3_9PROT|nr:enoyl-CoA hydratase/isomerase family protein [Usitatibacter palustris]QJR14938.1 1,4-dihydroxy-2-naphthoyl-CoA synthase [Usitatibacter palustris]
MEERLTAAGGDLIAEITEGVARITLNRPAALNAITIDMLRGLRRWLEAWAQDDRVRTVEMRGAGDKAFCAGGDLRALYDSFRAGEKNQLEYFTLEYALDHYIHRYPKPITAHLDAIVMGGGMGVSQGATLRIVGPRTKMAMPETAIGLFPDVGGGYFLSRTPGRIGEYLGLVGPTLGAADAIYCGLADEAVGLDPLPASELERLRPAIDRHFAHESVAAIIASLQVETRPEFAEWASKCLTKLSRHSPTLLLVTLEQVRRSRTMALADCFRMELVMVQTCFEQGDFIEGIRALIIDKDNTPHWNPPRLADVAPDAVESFFSPRWSAQGHPLAHLKDPE